MKILVDMNLSPDWVGFFERSGVEARHWVTVGKSDAPDREILEWAKIHKFVVFTHDLDFGAILAATGAASPSVVQARAQDVSPERLGGILIDVLKHHEEQIESGALVIVDEVRLRVRVLPLTR